MTSRHKAPIFVIQEHDATTRHHDFRLEAGGVLKSWVVPKGLSTDPLEKRLAVPTEDHALDHADFEGVIPEDEYGAGAVIVWDRGTYENRTEHEGKAVDIESGIEKGHIVVHLDGEKLQGGYALQKIADDSDGSGERWLVIKTDDDFADARRNPVATQRDSVVSGRTVDDVADASQGESSGKDE